MKHILLTIALVCSLAMQGQKLVSMGFGVTEVSSEASATAKPIWLPVEVGDSLIAVSYHLDGINYYGTFEGKGVLNMYLLNTNELVKTYKSEGYTVYDYGMAVRLRKTSGDGWYWCTMLFKNPQLK